MKEQTDHRSIHQTLLMIWASLLISHFLFFGVVAFMKPQLLSATDDATLGGAFGTEPIIVLVMLVMAVMNIFIGQLLRRMNLRRSVEEQSVQLVQTAMIMGCALAESASLFGVLAAFVVDHRYFWIFMIIGVIGTLLSFPSYASVENATRERNI